MEEKFTISETFTLPSLGKIYDEPINPEIELRSMTTREEMRRTAPSELMYKPMCDMIEACIVGKKPTVHVYDMCLGDYVFLLHKLRIVTYGSEYRLKVRCPNCGKYVNGVTDLNKETLQEWDDSILDNLDVTLPKSGHKIKLHYVTPRMLDEIQAEKARRLSKASGDVDMNIALPLTVQAIIDTVDGEKLSPAKKEKFVNDLLCYDLNFLLSKSEAVNEKIGLLPDIVVKCSSCGYDIVTSFRLESEFFNPTL